MPIPAPAHRRRRSPGVGAAAPPRAVGARRIAEDGRDRRAPAPASWPVRHRAADAAGQAAVEFVALLPLMAVLAAAAWQLVLAGHAMWSVGAAARAAARAEAVGADAADAARTRLTPALERELRVRREAGWVRVSVRIPSVLLPLGEVSATARFGQEAA